MAEQKKRRSLLQILAPKGGVYDEKTRRNLNAPPSKMETLKQSRSYFSSDKFNKSLEDQYSRPEVADDSEPGELYAKPKSKLAKQMLRAGVKRHPEQSDLMEARIAAEKKKNPLLQALKIFQGNR